jgi:hypothetical protein
VSNPPRRSPSAWLAVVLLIDLAVWLVAGLLVWKLLLQ